MLTIGLFPNTKKAPVAPVLDAIIHFLAERKVPVLMPQTSADALNHSELGCSAETLADKVTLAMTLGGDGTLLNTTRELSPYGIPVCGINLGQLGFLTAIELSGLFPALEKIIQGDYSIEERQMLQASLLRDGEQLASASALNDVVVAKSGCSRMIRLKLFIDGCLTANYPADGLIVATSTGSTGYSLSAGGPIVSPLLRVTVITPICPHSLNTRPLVVSDKEEIRIEPQATHDEIMLTIDGQTSYNLKSGDKILVTHAPFRARFIRFSGSSYYHSLWSRLRRSEPDDPV